MEIVIMGTQHCYECKQVKKELDKVGQSYIFVDIDKANPLEMQKVQRASAEGYRTLPIIEVQTAGEDLAKFITRDELFTLLKGQN